MRLKSIIMASAAVAVLTGCAPKTYTATSPIMSFDLTNVDITRLKSSKACIDGRNTDTSVRHAAQIAGINNVYGVDDHVIYETHLFGAPTVKSRCIIVYGTVSDANATVKEVTPTTEDTVVSTQDNQVDTSDIAAPIETTEIETSVENNETSVK